jgi:hypothetical protein
MARFFDEEELEDRIDCFGEFDPLDEICLKFCGLNMSCALSCRDDGVALQEEEEDEDGEDYELWEIKNHRYD